MYSENEMALKLPQYQIIRDRLSRDRTDCSARVLQLKTHFQDVINSQRVFEEINTMSHLFTVLEKRDVMGCAHKTNLLYITEIVAPHDNIIQGIFNSGIEEDKPNWNTNYSNSFQFPRDERVLPPVSQDCVEKIHTLIKKEIGKKWKEMARALAIGEGNIDALDERYRGYIPEMVNEILRMHQEDCGVNFELWRSKLQKALVTARRKDLSDEIDTILTLMAVH